MAMIENSEKIQALKALDVAMDSMMIEYSKKFAQKPTVADLEILYKLIDVDNYVDHYLEGAGEKPHNMYGDMKQGLASGPQQPNTQPGTIAR